MKFIQTSRKLSENEEGKGYYLVRDEQGRNLYKFSSKVGVYNWLKDIEGGKGRS